MILIRFNANVFCIQLDELFSKYFIDLSVDKAAGQHMRSSYTLCSAN